MEVQPADEGKGGLSLKRFAVDPGDSLILLLYGYHRLLGQDQVRSTALLRDLKLSGCTIDRLDRVSVPEGMAHKTGVRKGMKWAITNKGKAHGEALAAALAAK